MPHRNHQDLSDIPAEDSILLEVPMQPVSLQASRKKKDITTAAIRKALSKPRFLLCGDVTIDVEWWLHESFRYESISAPDVDNVLKVILDALSGPKGIIINDCQVQGVSCHWIDWTKTQQQFTIRINYVPGEWLANDSIRFVRFNKTLCLPIDNDFPPDEVMKLLQLMEKRSEYQRQFEHYGASYEMVRAKMPSQRFFHIGHVRGFDIVDMGDVKREIEEKRAGYR